MNKDDAIARVLNLTPKTVNSPTEIVQRETRTVQPINDDEKVESDFEYARQNMYEIIEKGQEALVGIMTVADQSQHPRAYEVAANLIKTMAETNKDLLELSKKKRELAPKQESPAQMANNMAVFVGSTSELQAMLKGKKTDE